MKCICPVCKNEFIQTNKDNVLDYIKNNPGCSFSDIHYYIRIAVKNVIVNCDKLENDGLIIVKRSSGLRSGIMQGRPAKCFFKDIE